MQFRVLAVVLLSYLSFSSVLALYVVQGSNCTSVCSQRIIPSTTSGSDITCYDRDYNKTAVGVLFRDCVACEIQSQTFDHVTGQTDVGWALFNMRYALSLCSFGFPDANGWNTSSRCSAACAQTSNALETNILTPNISTPYDYCQDPTFIPNVGQCASCYSQVPNKLYLSNFINTLKAACIAQPSPATPFPIDPSQIFTLQPPSVYPNSTATSSPAPSSGLSYNAKLAIGITIPLVLLALLSLLFLYWYVRIRPHSSKPKSNTHRRQHRGHPSIPSHPNQMSNYSDSIYSQQTAYPEPLRIRYSQPLTQSSGKRLSTIASTSPSTSPRASTPSGLTSWERAGIRNSMYARESRDLRRTSSERTNPRRSNSQRSNLQRTRSQLIYDTTNLPPSVKRGGTWKMKSQEDLFG